VGGEEENENSASGAPGLLLPIAPAAEVEKPAESVEEVVTAYALALTEDKEAEEDDEETEKAEKEKTAASDAPVGEVFFTAALARPLGRGAVPRLRALDRGAPASAGSKLVKSWVA